MLQFISNFNSWGLKHLALGRICTVFFLFNNLNRDVQIKYFIYDPVLVMKNCDLFKWNKVVNCNNMNSIICNKLFKTLQVGSVEGDLVC